MKFWIVWSLSLLIYLALNAVAVLLKSGVPGMATMIGWGIVMPIVMTIGWWVVASVNRRDISKWWLMGILSTAICATAGIVTVNVIGANWASI